MSGIKPFINQSEWGKDFLARFGNLLDEIGSINYWTVLPTTGKDGSPMGTQHTGYTGIVQSVTGESTIQRWSGSQWDTLLKVPLGIQGAISPVAAQTEQGLACSSFDPGVGFSGIYTFTNNNDGNFTLKRYIKATGTLAWVAQQSLEAGFAYAFLVGSGGARASFFEDNANVYIGIQSWTSATSSASVRNEVYAFNKTTGIYLWKTFIDTAASTLLIGLISNGGNLYCLQTFTTKVAVISLTSGALLSNIALSMSNSIDFANTSIDTANGNLIVSAIPQNTARLEIYVVNSTGSSIVRTYSSASSAVDNTFSFSNFINPAQPSKVYFFDYNNLGNDRLLAYDSATGIVETYANIPLSMRDISPIVGIKFDANQWDFYNSGASSAAGSSIRRTTITTQVPRTAARDPNGYFPSGSGNILLPRIRTITGPVDDLFYIKQSTSTLGFADTTSNTVRLTFSSLTQQITSLLGANLTSAKDTSTIQTENTFSTVTCSSLVSQSSISVATTIATPNASPGSLAANAAPSPDNGVIIGSYGRLFSTASNPGIHSASGTYAGGKIHTAGILMNAELIGGRVVNVNAAAGGSGLILYDCGLGKMFLQSRPSQATRNVLTDFPGGSGNCGIVIDPSNNVGVKTEAPIYPLDVNGTFRATEVRNAAGVVTSDPELKANMVPLDGADSWEASKELVQISFLYKPNFETEIQISSVGEHGETVTNTLKQGMKLPPRIQYGYNALEVKELFPELVDQEPQSGIHYLNRDALGVIFQRGATFKIIELEEQNTKLSATVAHQTILLKSLTARLEALENA